MIFDRWIGFLCTMNSLFKCFVSREGQDNFYEINLFICVNLSGQTRRRDVTPFIRSLHHITYTPLSHGWTLSHPYSELSFLTGSWTFYRHVILRYIVLYFRFAKPMEMCSEEVQQNFFFYLISMLNHERNSRLLVGVNIMRRHPIPFLREETDLPAALHNLCSSGYFIVSSQRFWYDTCSHIINGDLNIVEEVFEIRHKCRPPTKVDWKESQYHWRVNKCSLQTVD